MDTKYHFSMKFKYGSTHQSDILILDLWNMVRGIFQNLVSSSHFYTKVRSTEKPQYCTWTKMPKNHSDSNLESLICLLSCEMIKNCRFWLLKILIWWTFLFSDGHSVEYVLKSEKWVSEFRFTENSGCKAIFSLSRNHVSLQFNGVNYC